MINDGEIDRGSVFVVFFATMGGAFVLGRAGPQITLINAARGAATSMMDIIDRVCRKISPNRLNLYLLQKPEIDAYSRSGKTPLEPKGRIRFEGVHFSYATRKDVKVRDCTQMGIYNHHRF
jgi:ATP-binding cassette subfamily B (MDR/TAP) protein 1